MAEVKTIKTRSLRVTPITRYQITLHTSEVSEPNEHGRCTGSGSVEQLGLFENPQHANRAATLIAAGYRHDEPDTEVKLEAYDELRGFNLHQLERAPRNVEIITGMAGSGKTFQLIRRLVATMQDDVLRSGNQHHVVVAPSTESFRMMLESYAPFSLFKQERTATALRANLEYRLALPCALENPTFLHIFPIEKFDSLVHMLKSEPNRHRFHLYIDEFDLCVRREASTSGSIEKQSKALAEQVGSITATVTTRRAGL